MKTPAKFLSLFAATCFAFASYVHGQLVTYQTIQPDVGPPLVTGYSGSVDTFNGTTRSTQGEVFSNVLQIDSMTYNLFTTGSPSASLLSAEFGEWDTGTGAFVGSTLTWNSILVPDVGSWGTVNVGGHNYTTYELDFDITGTNGGAYFTNPNLTYALLISQVTPGNLNYGIGKSDLQSDFAYGYGIFDGLGGVSSIGTDFVFSQIVVEPNPVIPEASTVASILAALFVAGLVGLRLRQRRLQQLAPVPVLTA